MPLGRASGRAARSSRRELISSFANTLRRCHSTVRGLRNSCAAISGFVSPSRASRAICSSCGVSSSRVSSRRLRTFSPVARSSRRARSANASAPIEANASCAARSCSRASHAPALAPQPFAVQQPGASEVRAQSGAAQALDGLSIQALGVLAVAQQRAPAREHAERPVAVGAARRARRVRRRHARRSSAFCVLLARLDQLAQRPPGRRRAQACRRSPRRRRRPPPRSGRGRSCTIAFA